jgi:hypothetical protein
LTQFALQNFSGLRKRFKDGNKLSAHLQPDGRFQPATFPFVPAEQIEAAQPRRRPRLKPSASPPLVHARRRVSKQSVHPKVLTPIPHLLLPVFASQFPSVAPVSRPNLVVQPRFPRELAKRWWTRGGLCWARRSRRWWRVSSSAPSAAATRSSASRRRAGGRRAPTRSSSASACALPSVCSTR